VSSAGATIITDNKRAKQNFISALVESIRKWFKETSASSKQKSTPKYTVVDTQRRKGVIQRATTKTGTIFTADSETLKEEIRRRNWEQPAQPDVAPDITWSPNTEAGYALLDSGLPKPLNVTVEFKKRTIPEPLPVVAPAYIPPVAAVMPPPVFVEPTIPEPIVEPESQPDLVKIPDPALAELPTTSEVDPDYTLTTPEAHYRIKSIGDVSKLNTNILSIGIVGTIAGIIVVFIIGKALVGIVFENTPTVAVAPAIAIGLNTTVTDIALDTPSNEALVIALQQISTNGQPQQEFRITDAAGAPLQKQVLLPLLGFSNTGSLNQAITEVHILRTGNTLGIIFAVSDATTAFGSLLSFEGYMVEALGPILNIGRPTETLVVSDRTIQNTDIRIFTAGAQEVLVYGFINANTVLITKDITSFTAALGSK
jgi:hypothetical protein